jgi:hypothetical protein
MLVACVGEVGRSAEDSGGAVTLDSGSRIDGGGDLGPLDRGGDAGFEVDAGFEEGDAALELDGSSSPDVVPGPDAAPDAGDPCDGVTCSGHGTCVAAGPSCRCELGYHPVGLSCEPDVVGTTVEVNFSPQPGIGGVQRINFGLPLPPGVLSNLAIRIRVGGAEVPSGRRGLATWPDGSWRAVQVQVEQDVAAANLTVELGAAPTLPDLPLVPVVDTLIAETVGGVSFMVPRVWVRLPAEWLSSSGVFGRLIPESASQLAPASTWARHCNYTQWNTLSFLNAGAQSAREYWLYDRGTVFYRGYARRGDLATLQSAYRETGLYFSRVTLAGASASLNLPQGAGTDAKYVYAQNLAYHYLLSGDDRFREAAEGVATLADGLWDPGYQAGQHWTERHAGFTLLALVHAAQISDDRGADLWSRAQARVDAYLAVQSGYTETPAHTQAMARCFAHDKVAADEDGNYPANLVCSPWMSAILAEALDSYGLERGGNDRALVEASLIALGRRLAAADNVSGEGQPHYVLGVDGLAVPDDYHEHWGEVAYVVALADLLSGHTDAALGAAALRLAEGFDQLGEVGQLRSFNWQCRGSVSTPALLRP